MGSKPDGSKSRRIHDKPGEPDRHKPSEPDRFVNLVVRERHNMDIASPFVVVPVVVVVFFACILWATGGRTNSEQPSESSAGHMPE
jgi:hypothetical protein